MAENSVIGSGTVVSGHVRGQGSLEIFGRVEGDVTVTGHVSVGASGRVRGNINCAQLTVAGQVQGDLRGSEVVLVERGARVVGDIASPRIGVAPGALVRGHVQTDGEPALSQNNTTARRPVVAARVAAVPVRVVAPQLAPARVAPAEPRRPPPPVVPVISKGTKAKKKKGRD